MSGRNLGNENPITIEFGNETKMIHNWLKGKPLKVINGYNSDDNMDDGVFAIKKGAILKIYVAYNILVYQLVIIIFTRFYYYYYYYYSYFQLRLGINGLTFSRLLNLTHFSYFLTLKNKI